ncbi:hypothetical protein WDU94_010750 [Cyamophila willieti]
MQTTKGQANKVEQHAPGTSIHHKVEQRAPSSSIHHKVEQRAPSSSIHHKVEQRAPSSSIHHRVEQRAPSISNHRKVEQRAPDPDDTANSHPPVKRRIAHQPRKRKNSPDQGPWKRTTTRPARMNASLSTCPPASPSVEQTAPATPIRYLRRHFISPLPASPVRQIIPPQPIEPPTKPLAKQTASAMPVRLRRIKSSPLPVSPVRSLIPPQTAKPRLTSFVAQSTTQARPSRHRSRTPLHHRSRTPRRFSPSPSRHWETKRYRRPTPSAQTHPATSQSFPPTRSLPQAIAVVPAHSSFNTTLWRLSSIRRERLYPIYRPSPSPTVPMAPNEHVARIAVKIPEFIAADPELWFAMVDGSFTGSSITTESTKFGYIIAALPARYASEVKDIIMKPPTDNPYTHLGAPSLSSGCQLHRRRKHGSS